MILIITHPEPLPNETILWRELLAAGADALLLRRPQWGADEYAQLLTQMDPACYNRMLIAGHWQLWRRFGLMGVHLSESLREALLPSTDKERKNLLPSAGNVQHPLPPFTGNRQDYMLPSADDVQHHLPPSIGNRQDYMLLSADDVQHHLPPSIGNRQDYMLPSADDVQHHLPPSIGNRQDYMLPSANDGGLHLAPSTDNGPHAARHTTPSLLDDLRRQGCRLSAGIHSTAALPGPGALWDLLLLSPVFDSISKPGYKGRFQSGFRLPHHGSKAKVLALGGVDETNAAQARQMGFDGIALLGAIWQQPTRAVEQFHAISQQWNANAHM